MTEEKNKEYALFVEKKNQKKGMFVANNERKNRRFVEEKQGNTTVIQEFAQDAEKINYLDKKKNARNAWQKCTN